MSNPNDLFGMNYIACPHCGDELSEMDVNIAFATAGEPFLTDVETYSSCPQCNQPIFITIIAIRVKVRRPDGPVSIL